MSMQTKASFKKEFLAYFRTRRFLTIALVVIGLAVFTPLLISAMNAMVYSFSDFYYEEAGMDVTGMVELLGSASSVGVASTIENIASIGLIVTLILMNRAAGGEQKRRTVIIPQSAGLRSFPYIFPKFIIYPVFVLIAALVALLASWAVSNAIFEFNDLSLGPVLIAGALTGVHMMFYVCMHLTLGTATGRAGMSAAVCITASIFVPTIFASYSMDYMFNPFALGQLARFTILRDAITTAELIDIGISVIFVFGIMVAAFLIALFAQNARKIDNSGNEITL